MAKLSERAADKVSEFGGSWRFVFLFIAFFGSWIVFNSFSHPFDPFPYILLNLVLSCLSVFQAPFILMSQNRAAAIDRERAQKDYTVDVGNADELKALHLKIDLILKQLETK